MQDLVTKWRNDAAQYMKQVEEARRAGTPHEGMLYAATTYRECAAALEAALNHAPPKDLPTLPDQV